MDCPHCRTELERQTYEGQPLFGCETCHGYFVEVDRFKIIRSKRGFDEASLKEQVESQSQRDNLEQARCPRCSKKMKKESIGSESSTAFFFIDSCDSCNSLWLDGGELAKAQLKYEASAQALEEFRRRLALKQQTPAEKAEFKDNLQRLGDSIGPAQIAVFIACLVGLFLATIVLKGIGLGMISAATCLLFSIGLSVIALLMIDGAFEERLVAGGLLVAGVIASICLMVF